MRPGRARQDNASNPLIVRDRAFARCVLRGIHDTARLAQQRFRFALRTGLVLDAFRHDRHLTGAQRDGTLAPPRRPENRSAIRRPAR